MRRTLLYRLLVALTLVLSLASAALADGPAHWDYTGQEGPEFWGSLSKDYALCSTGKEQSPVDIPASAATNPADLAFRYQPSKLNILNNGHTVQAAYDPGSTLTVDGQTYNLAQFHFHLPSEHTVAGQPNPMELHLVHQNAQGGLAVVGILLKSGAENKALAPVFANAPKQETAVATVAGATVNAADFLPATRGYWRYNGSLTTPPCAEGVKWHVLTTPVEVSPAQLAAYQSILAVSNRPVQPLLGRGFLLASQVAAAPPALPTTGADQPVPWPALLLLGLACLSLGLGGYSVARERGYRIAGRPQSRP